VALRAGMLWLMQTRRRSADRQRSYQMAHFIRLTSSHGKAMLVNLDKVVDFHPGNAFGSVETSTVVVTTVPSKDGQLTFLVRENLAEIEALIPDVSALAD
jgi:hypothetical protein